MARVDMRVRLGRPSPAQVDMRGILGRFILTSPNMAWPSLAWICLARPRWTCMSGEAGLTRPRWTFLTIWPGLA